MLYLVIILFSILSIVFFTITSKISIIIIMIRINYTMVIIIFIVTFFPLFHHHDKRLNDKLIKSGEVIRIFHRYLVYLEFQVK